MLKEKPIIYIDCTHTYFSGLTTGIQRVVRKIIENIESEAHIVPVIFIGKCYKEVVELPVVVPQKNKINLKNLLKQIYIKVKNSLKFVPFLYQILSSSKVISYLNKKYDHMFFYQKEKLNTKKVVFQQNDTLLLLDSTWMDNDFSYLASLKDDKVNIITVMYDIIPITHSQYCSDELVKVFHQWLEKIYPISDGFISISKTVNEQVFEFFNNKYSDVLIKKFDYFRLGADIQRHNEIISENNIRYKSIFDKNRTFLTVCTIEPRKNHRYILNVFEKLWEKGFDINYVMIGRKGWKMNDFIEDVENHIEYNKRLFLLDNIDDNMLIYAYQNSKAMIFASFAEGFGLPIIESLHTGLQVLASDIPIHREIGGDFVSYFDLGDKNTLLRTLEKNNYEKDLTTFTWKTWNDSSKQLIKAVLNMVQKDDT